MRLQTSKRDGAAIVRAKGCSRSFRSIDHNTSKVKEEGLYKQFTGYEKIAFALSLEIRRESKPIVSSERTTPKNLSQV